MLPVVSFLIAKTGSAPIYKYPLLVKIVNGLGVLVANEEYAGQKVKSLDEVKYTYYFSERQAPFWVCRSFLLCVSDSPISSLNLNIGMLWRSPRLA